MIEQTVALCRQLGAAGEREILLRPLARAACEKLESGLRPGVKAEDCGGVFPLAAALLVMEHLSEIDGEDRISGFTAGDVSVRTEQRGGGLSRRAWDLLAPWSRERGFAVMGVRG